MPREIRTPQPHPGTTVADSAPAPEASSPGAPAPEASSPGAPPQADDACGDVYAFPLSCSASAGGRLIPMETGEDIPFPIARVFFIRDLRPGTVRGRHAHLKLREVLVCVQGSCRVGVTDGRAFREFSLDAPDRALYVGPRVWLEISDASPDCIILALASTPYDPGDRITDYAAFLDRCARPGAQAPE